MDPIKLGPVAHDQDFGKFMRESAAFAKEHQMELKAEFDRMVAEIKVRLEAKIVAGNLDRDMRDIMVENLQVAVRLGVNDLETLATLRAYETTYFV